MCRTVNLYEAARRHTLEESIAGGQSRGNVEISTICDPEYSVFLRY
jgi:hypothetical protein